VRTEYTRQTRWAHPPDPPGAQAVAIRQVVWTLCSHCDLQVHALRAHLLATGPLPCPECGRPLPWSLPPPAAREALRARVLAAEAACTDRIPLDSETRP